MKRLAHAFRLLLLSERSGVDSFISASAPAQPLSRVNYFDAFMLKAWLVSSGDQRLRLLLEQFYLLVGLEGSVALPRIVAALLENNQCEEGIRIPKALQPYFGDDMIR